MMQIKLLFHYHHYALSANLFAIEKIIHSFLFHIFINLYKMIL